MTELLTMKCLELAEEVLRDEPCSYDPDLFNKHRKSLTEAIQLAIHDWFAMSEKC